MPPNRFGMSGTSSRAKPRDVLGSGCPPEPRKQTTSARDFVPQYMHSPKTASPLFKRSSVLKRAGAEGHRAVSRHPLQAGAGASHQGLAEGASPTGTAEATSPSPALTLPPPCSTRCQLAVPVKAGADKACPPADESLPGLMPGMSPESGQRQQARAHPPCCKSSARHCAPVLPAAPAPPHAPQPPHPGTSRSQPCSAFPFPNGTPAAT